MTCSLIYDFAGQGFSDWWFLLLGLSLGLLGIVFFIGAYASFRRRTSVFNTLFCIGSAIFSVGWIGIGAYQTAQSYTLYRKLLDTRSKGQETRIDGIVENFSPYNLQNHISVERFQIDDHVFSYSPNEIRPGFRQTQERGGPIQNGLYLRVSFVGDTITHLETCHQ
jgi:hypothetical protein